MPPFDSSDLTGTSARRQTRGALVVLAVALVMLFLPPPAQQAVATGLRSTALRPFLALQEGLVQARLRSAEVSRLQAELDSLHLALLARRTLEDENQQLRALLDLGERLGQSYVAAGVIRPGTPGSESMFLLDVGERDGVASRAPVITREGLAGVVRELHPGSAVGMDWTHPDFRASAMTEDGLTFGWVESQRGEFREGDRLLLSDTPFSTQLAEGTVVLTSGLGGVFPRGIPVGRVTALAEAEGGWRKSYWLEPFVDVGSLTHALVARAGPGELPDSQAIMPFPPEDRMPRREFVERMRARADSLERLTEEVARLRARLDSLERGGSANAPEGGEG